MSKVVLAWSGGLDTAICIHWLRKHRNLRVIAFSAHVGQRETMEPMGERALELGAHAAHMSDLRETFLRDYAFRALRAQAGYGSSYLLSAALTRPLIVSELVRVAYEEGCEFVAHGCRGVGNDQVRFERALRDLAPDLKILAPLQALGLRSPQDDIEFAQKMNIPDPTPRSTLYNVEENLWGVSICLDRIRDLWSEAPADTYVLTCNPADAPERPAYVEIGFAAGMPTTVDGRDLGPVHMIETLNQLAGRHGIGRADVVESRVTGVKSRELYESPGATLLYAAHQALEEITLDRETLRVNSALSREYGQLVYEGAWYSPLRTSLDAYFEAAQKPVCGEVRMKLQHGTLTCVGRRSPNSLYTATEVRPPSASTLPAGGSVRA